MSKFTDKLSRLHASRVRALETEDPDEPRIFVADAAPTDAPPSAAPQEPSAVERTPAREAVRQQLELGRRVESRTRAPARVAMRPAAEQSHPRRAPAPASPAESDNAIGERLAELRVQAEALIAVGGTESALPLLHEMAALSPTHPYPLSQLANYWRDAGQTRLADLYASRLAAVAPY